MKREALTIQEFMEKVKFKGDKLIEVRPYVLEFNGKYIPALELESENVIYGRIVPKRFEKIEDVEDFVEMLSRKLSMDFYCQNFSIITRNLVYTKNLNLRKLREEDLEYLMKLGYFE